MTDRRSFGAALASTVLGFGRARAQPADAGTAPRPSWLVVTRAYRALSGDQIIGDTRAGSFTIHLPAAPTVGAIVAFSDAFSGWGTNNLTIDGNGSTIEGSSSTLIANVAGDHFTLLYINRTTGWKAQS